MPVNIYLPNLWKLELYCEDHPLLAASVIKGCCSTLRSLKFHGKHEGLIALANLKTLEHLEFDRTWRAVARPLRIED
jgi:hypothetical protein